MLDRFCFNFGSHCSKTTPPQENVHMSALSFLGQTERIESLGQLICHVTMICNSDNTIRWFRGQEDATWGVWPSLWRDFDRVEERNLTNRFRTRAALRMARSINNDDHPAWLSIMQHYGLPTRLLDWSRSPLVAAYFALSKYKDKSRPARDAAIWVLNPHRLNQIEEDSDLTFPISAWRVKPYLKPAFSEDSENDKVIAVMANETDLRMFVQQGAFTVHSSMTPLNERLRHPEYLTRLLIPAEAVSEIALQLYAAGMRRGDLFPDLTNLADELVGKP